MSTNPFLIREAAAPRSSHGKKYEKKGALSLAASLTPASGAMVGAKGDMRKRRNQLQSHLIEAKSTTANSLSVQLAWLVKISEEALAQGMQPALLMAFVTPEGRPVPHCESQWVALPLQVYNQLMEDSGNAQTPTGPG